MRHSWSPAVAALILSTLWCAPALAQGSLRITVVEGEGAINNVRQRVNRDPIVQVEDENRRPVSGAAVVFFLPDQGPSGTFLNGQRSITVTTNAQGRATATGLRSNNTAGQMQIRVTASAGGATASAVINQVIAAKAAAGLGTTAKILIVLGVVGAAAAGGVVASGGGDGGPGPASIPSVSLAPGSPVVGGPR